MRFEIGKNPKCDRAGKEDRLRGGYKVLWDRD